MHIIAKSGGITAKHGVSNGTGKDFFVLEFSKKNKDNEWENTSFFFFPNQVHELKAVVDKFQQYALEHETARANKLLAESKNETEDAPF